MRYFWVKQELKRNVCAHVDYSPYHINTKRHIRNYYKNIHFYDENKKISNKREVKRT